MEDTAQDLTKFIRQFSDRFHPVEMKQFDLIIAITQIYAALHKIDGNTKNGTKDSLEPELDAIQKAIQSFLDGSRAKSNEPQH